MAKVIGQNIPAEIEESFTKLLTKEHKLFTPGGQAIFKTFPYGEKMKYGYLGGRNAIKYATFKYGENQRYGQSGKIRITNRRARFHYPPQQGIEVHSPTPKQHKVRGAFKACTECWNKLSWGTKTDLYYENEENGYDEDYYRYFMHLALPYFYYDVKYSLCPDTGEALLRWKTAYWRSSGVIIADNFETGWTQAANAWNNADWEIDPDPNIAQHTGFFSAIRYLPAEKKYLIAITGIKGIGEFYMETAKDKPYLLRDLKVERYPHFTSYENGLIYIPHPTAAQAAINAEPYLDFITKQRKETFLLGSDSWRNTPLTLVSFAGNHLDHGGNYWVEFDLHNSYYDPLAVKGEPPQIDDTYVYGGIGKHVHITFAKK